MEDADLIAEFAAEATEHLADVERQLLDIEAAGASADADLVNQVFRAIHSTKGASSFFGLTNISKLAHEAENVLNLVRNREFVLDGPAVDTLLRATDLLRTMVRNASQSNEINIDAHLADVKELLKRAQGAPAGETPSPVTPIPAATPVPAPSSATEAKPPEPTARPPKPTPASNVAPSEPAKADANVRISVQILDKLMNLAGELVLSRNQLMQAIDADGRQDRHWHNIGARIDQVTTELQEAITDSRLQPVGNVFAKFPRVVRDLATKLQKQCDLRIEGQEVELDKTIIEAIADPLTHLIRNSLDHGIERPSVRAERNKPAAGTITLRAQHRAGKVLISVVDDGGGIDPNRLRSKAVAKGIVTQEQAEALSDREAVRLIFHPGFSTAEAVSDVSGRGVGMDVVKTNIERIGGAVEVHSTVGSGAAIEISLPLTLAIMPSLIVHCAGQRYAIPQSMIKELVAVRPNLSLARIERIGRREALRMRGQLMTLIRLDHALGFATEPEDGAELPAAAQVVILDAGQYRYALAVDRLEDPEEIVVKPLGKYARASACLAGATILGDGDVAFILDVAGLASRMRVDPLADDVSNANAAATRSRELHAILLFRQNEGEQFGVPMASITRIDRVAAGEIRQVGDREVMTRDGRMIPLIRLERHLQVSPLPSQTSYHVLVFTLPESEFGVLAARLEEVQDLPTAMDLTTIAAPGVLGSLVVGGTPTRVLDVFALGRTTIPARETRAVRDDSPVRVLLADDSDFFRRQISSMLAIAGHDVTECPDGEAAWTLLQENPDFDLVVTDVEMPGVDGVELCRRIKSDERFADMPVIAISAGGPDGGKRTQGASFDEFESKSHRDQLTRAVARQMKRVASRAAASTNRSREKSCR